MSDLHTARRDLALANRILAHEQVFDSYGHVSVRHPERAGHFLLAASLSPEQVGVDDILEYDADAQPLVATTRAQYSERVIHAEVYRQRPDVQAVVHAHSEAVLPFTVTSVKLRPLLHVAGIIGHDIPVWDMRHAFADSNLLVTTPAHGRSLAATLGQGRVVLMRGHGFTAVAGSLELAVRVAIYLNINARARSRRPTSTAPTPARPRTAL